MTVSEKFLKKALDKYPVGVYNMIIRYPIGVCEGVLFMNDKECCCGRKKKRSEEEFKSLMNRLKRIEGQVRGVEKMLENDAYCLDILTQVSAINSALNSFNKELLASHMKSCVVNDIRAGKDEVIDELVATLQKIMK